MNQLLIELDAIERTRKAGALSAYREIVGRCQNPQPGDSDRLDAAMRTLGLSIDDAKTDVNAVEAVSHLTANMERLEAELAAAREKLADGEAKAQSEIAQAKAEQAAVLAERDSWLRQQKPAPDEVMERVRKAIRAVQVAEEESQAKVPLLYLAVEALKQQLWEARQSMRQAKWRGRRVFPGATDPSLGSPAAPRGNGIVAAAAGTTEPAAICG